MPKDPRAFKAEGERFEEIIIVCVGSEKRRFTMHEHVLCQGSPFFAASIKKDWKEGHDRLITLEEDHAHVFELYARWKYRNKIFSRKPAKANRSYSDELNILIGAYIFAEKIQDEDFQDAIIDAIIMCSATPDREGSRKYPTGTAIDRAYQGTPVGSPIRRLMVDFYVLHGRKDWIGSSNNHDFLLDLVKELYAVKETGFNSDTTSATSSSCSYHRHTTDQGCYSRRGESD